MKDPLVETRSSRGWHRQPTKLAFGRRILAIFVLALLSGSGASPVVAEELSRDQMQGLDEQVQEIKSDVLGIAAELNLLEERLLYPSNTQVAIFVSLTEGDTSRLDSLQIQIDGEPVARHIYSFKELEALRKGGVQRIYTGNLATGEHQLEVTIAGKLLGGSEFDATQSFQFSKAVEPKLIGMTLAPQASGDASIRLGDW